MENDKQITNINTQIDQVKQIFLSDELLVKNVQPEVYSLPEEFAKSKRNKGILVYSLILIYILAIGAGVYFVTTIEDYKSKRIEVNIAEFRQFNLLELLAEKKANEEKLAQLQQELENLRTESMKEIQKLSPKSQQKAIAELNERMKKLEDAYRQQISSKELALHSLEQKISLEQQKLAKSYQESQSEVKKYQNLNQMQGAELVRLNTEYETAFTKLKADHQAEIERLKVDYEGKIAKLNTDHQSETERLKKEHQTNLDAVVLRYNPVFSHGEVANIIRSKPMNSGNTTRNKFDKLLPNESIYTEQDYHQLRKKMQNQQLLINALQNIPYTNSVPPALNQLDNLSLAIFADYETLWSNLMDRLKEKNQDLGSYQYAINYLAVTRHESGFVIDARNPNRISIFVDRIYSIKKGDSAYILKNDDQPVAKIELTPERGRVVAKIKEILKPVKIEPFDKILLKLEVAQ